jgi:hypothetical protein
MAVKLEIRFDVDRIVTPKPARRPAAIIIDDDDPPLLRVSKKSGKGKIARGNIPASETDHSDARVTKKKGRVSNTFMSLSNATLTNNFTRPRVVFDKTNVCRSDIGNLQISALQIADIYKYVSHYRHLISQHP